VPDLLTLRGLAFSRLALFATFAVFSAAALATPFAFSGAFAAGPHLALALARIHHRLLVLVGRILGDTLLVYLCNEICPGCHSTIFLYNNFNLSIKIRK
jgi:hypothetical protein